MLMPFSSLLRHKSPLLTAASAAVVAATLFAATGCANKPKAVEPEDPAKLAEIEARQRQETQMRQEAAQLKRDALTARQQAAELSAEARLLRETAALDVHKAQTMRHDAALLRSDGHTNLTAGYAFNEMSAGNRGPNVLAQGQRKIDTATKLDAKAAKLVADADVKHDQADGLDARAQGLRDDADQLVKRLNEVSTELATIASIQ